MDVEIPMIGFEEMVIPDWVGAGICIRFKDILMYRLWQRHGCRHKHLTQEMTIKQAMN